MSYLECIFNAYEVSVISCLTNIQIVHIFSIKGFGYYSIKLT